MKTRSVRLKEEYAAALEEFANMIPGFSITGGVNRAVELWLEVEGPVYRDAFDGKLRKLRSARQPVASNEMTQ